MSLTKRGFAEFLGTFWLVFGGCGSAVLAAAFPNVGIGLLGVALAFGLTVLTMAYAIGHISGCHLNPAVSVGLAAARRFPAAELPAYIAAQVLGGIAGAGALYIIASGKPGFDIASGLASNGYGVHSPGGYSMMAGLFAEVLLTFFFLMIILGATDKRAPQGLAPVAIGFGLTLIHLIGIPITNLSVNPARSTGPAIMVGGWALQQLWLFWVAPITGALLAASAYALLGAQERQPVLAVNTAAAGHASKTASLLIPFALLLLFCGNLRAADKEDDRLKAAGEVLTEILNIPDNIPHSILDRSECVIVFPSVKKFAIGIGGSYGRGAMSCRSGESFTGPWGPPALYALEGGNIGLQLGGQETDFVLLAVNPKGVDSLLKSKVKLGADASAAIGPKGRDAEAATDVLLRAEILTYSRSRGLFAGVSLEGSTLREDGGANEKVYGKKLTARQIVRQHAVNTPAAGRQLVATLQKASPTNRSDPKSLRTSAVQAKKK